MSRNSRDRSNRYNQDEGSDQLISQSFNNAFSKSNRSSYKQSNSNFNMRNQDDELSEDSEEGKMSSGSDYMMKGRGRPRGSRRGRRPSSRKSSIIEQDDDEQMNIDDEDLGMPSFGPSSSKSKKNSKHRKSDIFMESESEDEELNEAHMFSDDENEIPMSKGSKNSHPQRKEEMESEKDDQNQQSDDSARLQKQQMMSNLQNQSNNSKSKKSSMFIQSSDQSEQQPLPNSNTSKLKKQDTPNQYNPTKLQDYPKTYQNEPNQPPQISQQLKKQIQQKNIKIRKYADQFAQYKIRRVSKYINGKLDMNVRYLHELVYDCYVEGLICQELMLGIKYMGLGNSLEFIDKYKEEKLIQFDFKRVKFTIFDHRRLAKLLKEKSTKNQYTDEKPLYFMPYQLHNFMNEVYQLPQDAYDALCVSIDQAYELTWWKTIGTELKGKQPQIQPKQPQRTEQAPKRKQPKRVRYKAKITQQKSKDKMQEQNSDKQISNQKIRIEQYCLKRDNDIQISQSQIQIDSSIVTSNKKSSKPDNKSSLYSSSIFQTEQVLDSSFSMDSNTHSLEDVSDLLHQFSISEKQPPKKSKNTKQVLEEKQMQKVIKGSQNLKKIQQKFKNKQKIKQQQIKPKEKKELKRQKRSRKIEIKRTKQSKEKQKRRKISQSLSQDNSDIPQESSDSSYNSDDI